MRRFLQVTVERTLDGATDQVKEFSLGRDVFDRGEDYDPRTDSIVRVEARRLRKKLRVYYEREGVLDRVIIEFPPGKYVPKFSSGTQGVPAEKGLDPKTVAVLPFSNLSSDPEQNYFCDGISEDIIDALSTVRDLQVLGRGATFLFREPAKDPHSIGVELGAGTIVEGSVRKSGGMLRVSARLIDTETGHVRWSTTVNRPETDVFAIKDEIATAIAATLCDQFDTDKTKSAVRLPVRAPNLDAYALYLRGRYEANRLDAEGYRAAVEFYSRAIAEFPEYALPYSGMADIYTAMTSWSMARPLVVMPIAKLAAQDALRLDPGLAQAYTSLAWVAFCFEWNWTDGMALAQKAVTLDPNYAYGHMTMGAFNMVLGRISEGRERLEQALRLSPLLIRAHRLLGYALTMEGKFEESGKRLQAARALMPDSCELAWMMAAVYMAQGRLEEGLRYAQECQTDPVTPRMLGMLGEALARSGQQTEAIKILHRVEEMATREYVDPWSFCRQHMALGDREKALDYLERSFDERSTLALFAHIDPLLEPLRTDPRFRAMIDRLHLPQASQFVIGKC